MRPQRYLVLLTFLLATLSAVSAQTSTDGFSFEPPPGSYPQSIDVSVARQSESASASPGSPKLWYRFTEDSDSSFLPVGSEIPLTAIPGATLSYTIELASGLAGAQEVVATGQYRIDAEAPAAPRPDPVPGVHQGAVDLRFQSETDASIRYLFARSASQPQSYSGPVRLDTPPGERSEYTVIAVAEDAAGNLSEAFEGRYIVDRTDSPQGEAALRIASPVPGEFANRQLLVVESAGLSGIRYTTDGSQPYAEGNGTRYGGPVLIEKTGSYTVAVAGMDATGEIHRRSVTVTAGGEDLLALDQGVFAEDRQVPAPDGTVYFTTDERTPSRADRRFSQSLRLSPSAGVARNVVLRLLVPEGAEGSADEYRYVYVLEGRTPARPEAIVHRSPGTDAPLHVSLLSSPGAAISYTLDGSNPGPGRRYDGGFTPDLPDDRDGGTLQLTAVARYSGSVESDPLVFEIPYDTAAPAAPSPQVVGSSSGRQVTVRLASGNGDGHLVYSLRDTGREEGSDSPVRPWSRRLEGETLTLRAPEGSDRTLQLSVARVDESGNIAPSAQPVELTLDGKAPPPPVVSVDQRRVTLEGERIRFRLKPDTIAEDPSDHDDDTFENYESPIFLTARPNGRIVYDLRAFSRDEYGNAGEVTTRRVVADSRTPALPQDLAVTDGAAYGDAVTLRNNSEEADLELRYGLSYSDDAQTPPEDPGAPPAGQVVGRGVTLDAPEDTERRYRLALQPVFASSGRAGEVVHFQFTVDRRPPEPPRVLGVVDGETYGHGVSFTLQADAESDRVEYALAANSTDGGDAESRGAGGAAAGSADTAAPEATPAPGDTPAVRDGATAGDTPSQGDPPGAEGASPAQNAAPALTWRDASDEVRVDVPVGEERRFTLRARSVDAAGNATEREEAVKFRIDRAAPAPPEIRLEGAGAVTPSATSTTRFVAGGTVRVVLDSEGQATYIRIEEVEAGDSEDGADSAEGVVTTGNRPYDGPIVLEAKAGVERTYEIGAIAVDAVGNESAPAPPVRVVLDGTAPPAPQLVAVYTDDSGRGGTAVWNHERGTVVRYRVSAGSTGGESYKRAERIGRWELPAGATRGEIEFFAEDAAGNRSDRATVAVRGFSAAPEPRLAGVENGAIYGEAVVIRNRTETGTVRYEVTRDGTPPGEVSRFSSALPESIPFDVAPGETVTYRVAARTFAEDARPSPVVSYSFTVDRGAPSAPEIVGIRDGDFLTEDVKVDFEQTDNTIRYNVVESPERASGDPTFQVFEDPFTLSARPGGVVHYRISAYSMDPAGNRSDGTQTWDLFLGKEIVYVSPNGSEQGEGTLDRPVNNLARAVEIARSQNKRTIFVARGSYAVDAPLTIDSSLTMQGGFDPESWRRSETSRSTLRLSESSFADGSAVAVQGGKLTAGRFDIEAAAPAGSSRYAITLRDSTAFLQGVSISLSRAGFVRQDGGDLTLKDAEVREDADVSLSLLHLSSGRMVLDEVRIDATRRTNGVPVIALERARLLMQGGSLTPGGGTRSLGLRASGSRVVLSSTQLSAGTGSRSARALEAIGGSLTLSSAAMDLHETSRIASAVVTDGTNLRVEGSDFELRGRSGATGISAQGGSVAIGRSRFAGRNVEAGYVYAVVLRSTSADLVGNAFTGVDTGEFVATRLSDTRLRYVNNTILGSRVYGAAFGLNASGGSSVLVQNSLFAKEGAGRGRAVYAADAESEFTLRTNSFSGWEVLYERSTGGFTQARPTETASLGSLNGGGGGLMGFTGSANIAGSGTGRFDVTTSVPRLDENAAEIDAGSPPPEDLPFRNRDIEGQERPAPAGGAFDIGADEFYR